MILFGLRLALAGGREAAIRLVTIALAVTLGVGLLLATLAGINAVYSQNARYAWLNTAVASAQTQSTKDGATDQSTKDPIWWLVRGDYFEGQTVGRVDVAATGPDSPVPPGIPALPGPGEYYASPALSALLADRPAAALADRFPGHQIGTIGDSALPAPNMLLIVVGHTAAEMSGLPGAQKVDHIATTAPDHCDNCYVGIRKAGIDLILSVVAAALLFPVLIFIGAATRLSATRREQRFAAMRLVGATPRQVTLVAAVESTVAAVIGTAAGFGLFAVLRHPLAAIPFTGAPFFPADLSLNLADVLAVALGVPVGAAIAARLALRRVQISPLGVTRRVTPRPPRWYRLIPLVLGLGELAWFIDHPRPHTGIGQVEVFLPGMLVTMAGLVIAGPWLTMVGARLLARRSGRPAGLIASRRLADNPQAAFRAISGVVLGLFVTTTAIAVITSIEAHRGAHNDNSLASTAMEADFWPNDSKYADATSVPGTVLDQLRSVPGVRSVTVVRRNDAAFAPVQRQVVQGVGVDPGPPVEPGLVLCADLARDPSLGHCADGATVAGVPPGFQDYDMPSGPGTAFAAAAVSADQLARLPVLSVVANTDGSAAALEEARTVLELGYPGATHPPSTEDDVRTDQTKTMTQWEQLANVVILASLPIAGCSLAVNVAGGLSDRKRPFSLLRLTGVPLRVLRRVVALESAVPLLAVAAVAIGTGLLAAHLFLRAQMQYNLHAPGGGYYAIVAIGLVASLAIIASTLPLLERITGPETARND
jgi:cell division protein FtsX